ncbi:uncharacterized protein LOC129737865 [Uranotaenia lowii]|uniref:uncharacterized protein LOC129737865 n=1 Tax=Uranotaenia lowii TaxID=190385 RepID=UPI00247A3A9B|nr:uncharacterized protein LOC129737865 [Uranotaenia lowii]
MDNNLLATYKLNNCQLVNSNQKLKEEILDKIKMINERNDQSIGKIEAAYTEDNGSKYVIKTRSAKLASKMMQMKELIDGTKIVVTPHPVFNVSRCVISCKEAIELTEKELETELQGQGVLKARRITRIENKKRVNTPTVVLNISGTVIPKEIRVVCYRCCSYGHTKDKCTNELSCRNCSKSHDLEEEEQCKEDPYCKNCQGKHAPISRKCPLYQKEEEIVKIKVESGITFGEARKEYAKKHAENSYANVCGAQQRLEQLRKDHEKDAQIAKLLEENAALKGNARPCMNENENVEKLQLEVQKLRKIAKEFFELKAKLKVAEESLKISESESDEEMEPEPERSTSCVQRKTASTVKAWKPLKSKTAKPKPKA